MSDLHARAGWADNAATRETRRRVMARDGGRCQIAGPRCTGVATEVDHVRALADGGSAFDMSNLRAACRACNAALKPRSMKRRAPVAVRRSPPSRVW